ncbi:UDP-2,4-diacetamido-2,4,6-trideoxy-beta-L-altropyranose hydrolase [uncultured Psychrobacter sp.]|uniref:UDP-2,4-diacetamido-2,4, 6-trideoxy-beta-L-altropyranose hydrolase n=1 Tax=uncultured Psychrobacter sp. TaxID=259303 RepID=UPI00263067C8|nr:UDP-2,4-diacetamido-2,4,6-trideoxy-beta-L-altropyranose hydrolase [uncultured Psychrobacter sp.]
MKTIAFRVDVAPHIGTGHLQRCLTLATQLKESFVKSIFFVRQYDGNLLSIIDDNDFEYSVIGSSVNKSFSDRHSEWLGVSQQEDAEDFLKSASTFKIDLLVIDHYSIDSVWEGYIKNKLSIPIVVIDDLANRVHLSDILIDQNYWPNIDVRYNGLLPEHAQKLLGPKYALLKPMYEEMRQSNIGHNERVELDSILVNFGGVGSFSLWQTVIPALLQCFKYNFHIITGKLPAEHYAILHDLVEEVPHIKMQETTDKMPELMNTSIYCLGACGSTVWERFCLGLNSALIDIAENQKELVEYLDEQEMIDYLGSLKKITTNTIVNFITNLQLESESYIIRRNRIQSLVDGLGSKRIASHIIKTIH